MVSDVFVIIMLNRPALFKGRESIDLSRNSWIDVLNVTSRECPSTETVELARIRGEDG